MQTSIKQQKWLVPIDCKESDHVSLMRPNVTMHFCMLFGVPASQVTIIFSKFYKKIEYPLMSQAFGATES